MSLQTATEPPSCVALWLTRSQRPSRRRVSPVAGRRPSVPQQRRSRHRPARARAAERSAIGAPGRSRSPELAEKIGRLRIGERDAALGVDDDDAFARALERVGEPRLRGAALGDLALPSSC